MLCTPNLCCCLPNLTNCDRSWCIQYDYRTRVLGVTAAWQVGLRSKKCLLRSSIFTAQSRRQSDLRCHVRSPDCSCTELMLCSCSPARPSEGYPAYGHSSIVDAKCARFPLTLLLLTSTIRGQVIATTDEKESVVFGEIDIDFINATRTSIPLTAQRRFDVYPDVAVPP